jgi:two-component system response regulator FlrC
MESELFGHEKGAFSGADARRIGKFEAADGGTLLLDEIGELPLEMQSKLLRVLQEDEVDRLGGVRPIPIDIRLIATTNRDLKEMVRLGTFREDLYYRINVFPLNVPPLRARMEDLIPLTGTLIDRLASRLNRPAPRIASDAIAKLRSWTYPGNIRELNNILERALILASGEPIEATHIHLDDGSEHPHGGSSYHSEATEWLETHVTLRELERTAILRTLALCEGNRTHASDRLGISIRTLRNRLKEYRSSGIPVPAPPNAGSSELTER